MGVSSLEAVHSDVPLGVLAMSVEQMDTEPRPEDEEEDEEESDEEESGPPPNMTIRVNNLNEKVRGPKLKSALKAVFKQFGDILDIVSMDSVKRRGQAFIVFDKLESAADAKSRMQGFPFYDKPMRIEFAFAKSDVITRREGGVPEDAESRKQKRVKRWAEEKKNPPPPKKVKPQAEIPAMSAVPAPTQVFLNYIHSLIRASVENVRKCSP